MYVPAGMLKDSVVKRSPWSVSIIWQAKSPLWALLLYWKMLPGETSLS